MKTNNVIETMATIVEKRVQLYKSDFYEWDMQLIDELHPREFVWLVRPTGTDMMIPGISVPDDWDYFYELYGRRTKWFYYVRLEEGGGGEVTLSKKKCDALGRSAA